MKIERDPEKPGTWKLDATIAGKRIRERAFKSKRAVEEFVTELKEGARRARYGLAPGTVPVKLADLAKAHIKRLGKGRNDLRAKALIELFAECFSVDAVVQDLKAVDITNFVRELRRQNPKLKADSVNRYLANVKTMFREAPALFRALEDWSPPRFPWEKVSKRGRERVITREEQRLLLEALRFPGRQKYQNRLEKPSTIAVRRDVADALEIGCNTAMRPGEVRTLRWSQIDFDAREAHLPETKNGEPGDVPLNTRVMEILKRRQAARTGSWVFPNAGGTGPRDEISKVLRPLAISLGLEYGRELENGFTPHSQRHTATTEMMRRGHDLATVKSVTRHSDTTMALRYAHASHGSRRSAVEDLVDPGEESGRK